MNCEAKRKNEIPMNPSKGGMENFEQLFLQLSETQPNMPLSPVGRSHIQLRFKHLFSDHYKPPIHPPYPQMIKRAIEELNEKGGSKEESISKYLQKEYKDLPLAHPMLLKHHLAQLSQSRLIFNRLGNRYMLHISHRI